MDGGHADGGRSAGQHRGFGDEQREDQAAAGAHGPQHGHLAPSLGNAGEQHGEHSHNARQHHQGAHREQRELGHGHQLPQALQHHARHGGEQGFVGVLVDETLEQEQLRARLQADDAGGDGFGCVGFGVVVGGFIAVFVMAGFGMSVLVVARFIVAVVVGGGAIVAVVGGVVVA